MECRPRAILRGLLEHFEAGCGEVLVWVQNHVSRDLGTTQISSPWQFNIDHAHLLHGGNAALLPFC